jgi:hypothetical protein
VSERGEKLPDEAEEAGVGESSVTEESAAAVAGEGDSDTAGVRGGWGDTMGVWDGTTG